MDLGEFPKNQKNKDNDEKMSEKYSDSKHDYKASEKGSGGSKGYAEDRGEIEEEIYYADEKNIYGDADQEKNPFPQVNVTEIIIRPNKAVEVSSRLSLDIKFELDRDVVAAFWTFKLLVDSAHSRIIQVLGQSEIQDYPDGESDVQFSVEQIDISHIPPSTLTNSGLLMATFVVDDEEVATVNMVSNKCELINGFLSFFSLRWFRFLRKMA